MSTDSVHHRNLAEAEDAADAFARDDYMLDFDAPTPEVPPAPTGEPMVVVSARVPQAVYDHLQAEAQRRGVRYSAVMREWLELQSAAHEPDRVVHLVDVLRALSGVRDAA